MIFNVLAKNCDDHTKNFAFRLKKDQNWELSPAYDVCYAYSPDSIWVKQHALSINGKRKDISKDDLLAVAKSMNIKKPQSIIAEIGGKIAAWNYYAEKTGVNSKLRDTIKNEIVIL
jgi:serine/threonine-protein kinase HipA